MTHYASVFTEIRKRHRHKNKNKQTNNKRIKVEAANVKQELPLILHDVISLISIKKTNTIQKCRKHKNP